MVFIVGLSSFKGIGQNKLTTIVNYDFNSGATYPALAPSLAANITCAATSTEMFATITGTATGGTAFTANATGPALSMSNSSGNNARYFQFQLGGAALSDNSNYKIYFQSTRSNTGAQTITLAYSTDNITYNNFTTTVTVTTSFAPTILDLSSIIALNNQSTIYFRLLANGASGSGSLTIDNFQIQGQTTPKYYRSQTSADWNNVNTWQSSPDNSIWSNATLIPSSVDKTISIQTGHTVTAYNFHFIR